MLDSLLNQVSSMMSGGSPWLFLLVFIGGVLSSFLPCSLSTVPLVIGYVGAGRRDVKRSFVLSLLYAIGLTVTYTVLSLAALALGRMMGSTGRIWYLILSVLMLMMGLQLLHVFNFIPASYLQRLNKSRGALGAVLSGMLSGVFSSPCSTPVLVAVLSLASMSSSPAFSVGLMLSYAAGYSILSILAGTFTGFVSTLSSSPRFEKAGRVVEVLLAIAVLALGFYMAYQAF